MCSISTRGCAGATEYTESEPNKYKTIHFDSDITKKTCPILIKSFGLHEAAGSRAQHWQQGTWDLSMDEIQIKKKSVCVAIH